MRHFEQEAKMECFIYLFKAAISGINMLFWDNE